MADIQRGTTFTTSIPDAASLHSLVDAATILPTFITGKSVAAPVVGDSFVFAKSGALKSCTLAGLIGAFPSGGAANTFSLRKLGTDSTTAAAGNDPRFPSRITGIRKANNTAPDTVAGAADLSLPPVDLGAGTSINWTLATTFTNTLAGNKTFTLVGGFFGQTITVIVKLNAHTITFTGATVATVGAGTNFAHCYLTRTSLGITGVCVYF